MTHFFEKRDPWGNGLAMWVIVAMVFAAPLGWLAIKQTRLENDVEKWLPENDPELKVLRWAHQQFPLDERVYVTWDGSSLNDPRIDLLVEKLEGRPDADGIRRGGLPHIASVVEPRQLLASMQKHGVKPQEAVRRLEGVILGAGSLKLRLTEFGKSRLRRTRQELTAAAKGRFGIELQFSDPIPDFATLVAIPPPAPVEGEQPVDPAAPAVMNVDGKLLTNETVDHDLQVVWRGIRPASPLTREVTEWMTQFVPPKGEDQTLVERCFFAPGSPVTMALSISDAGVADKTETIEVIKSAALSVGIALDALHLGGSAVVATELNHEVLKAAWDRSQPVTQLHRRSVILTSVLVGAVLAYLLVRSIRLATIVLAVSLYATFISTALVTALGGSMNMVIVVMPTLLMVLTLSGAIHVANYWKHAACKNAATAIVDTVRTSWMPCALASLTTAIGLVSLCTSSLTPVRDFGIYAALGMVLSLVMVLYALPALLQLWPGKPPEEHELDHPGWRMLGRGLTTWPVLQSLIFIAICAGCSYGLTKFRTETKVIRYFPQNARIAQDYWFIETHLAGIMPIETIIRFDTRSQQETNFLDRMEVVREITERMRSHAEITGAVSLPDFQTISERPDANAGFITKGKYNKKANSIQQRIRDGEIPSANAFYNVAERGHDLSVAGDNRLNEPGDELWRISAQVAVMTENDFGRILTDVNQLTQDVLKMNPGSMHTITGTVPLFLRTQKAVLESLVSSFSLAFVLILGVFVVMLRSFWAGLVAMIPNIVPITVVFGIISWMGQKIDVGTMITASIALGIAVDGTLHYLTWVQLGMKNGQPRRDAIVNALGHCGPAMWQTSLAVTLGLLVLVPAELLLISRFGWLMAAMIGVALLGNVVFLPQLLAGPLGYLFEPATPPAAAPAERPLAAAASGGREPDEPDAVPQAGSPPAPHLKSLGTKRKGTEANDR
ncbi:MAG: MMPL family transporter [Planctomycetota bacterium]